MVAVFFVMCAVMGVAYIVSQTWLRAKELEAQRPKVTNPLPEDLSAEILAELRRLHVQNEALARRLEAVETIVTADPEDLARAVQLGITSVETTNNASPATAAEILAQKIRT